MIQQHRQEKNDLFLTYLNQQERQEIIDDNINPHLIHTAITGDSKSHFNHMNSDDWGPMQKVSPFMDNKGGSVSPGSMLKAMQQTRFEMTQLSEETGSEDPYRQRVKVRVQLDPSHAS